VDLQEDDQVPEGDLHLKRMIKDMHVDKEEVARVVNAVLQAWMASYHPVIQRSAVVQSPNQRTMVIKDMHVETRSVSVLLSRMSSCLLQLPWRQDQRKVLQNAQRDSVNLRIASTLKMLKLR